MHHALMPKNIPENTDSLHQECVEDRELRKIVEARTTEMPLALDVELDDL